MPVLNKIGLIYLWGKIKGYVDRKFNQVNSVGLFSFEMQRNGDLYVNYPDGNAPPDIEYDPETGNVYLNMSDWEGEIEWQDY